MVMATDQCGKPIHCFLDNGRAGQIIRVRALACLEVDIGVLCCATDERMVRRESTRPVSMYPCVVDHGPHVIAGQLLNLVDLMRGAKTVKEVQERDTSLQCCCMGNQCQILCLLWRIGSE